MPHDEKQEIVDTFHGVSLVKFGRQFIMPCLTLIFKKRTPLWGEGFGWLVSGVYRHRGKRVFYLLLYYTLYKEFDNYQSENCVQLNTYKSH